MCSDDLALDHFFIEKMDVDDVEEKEVQRLLAAAREELIDVGIVQEDEEIAHVDELAYIDDQLAINKARMSELFKQMAPYRQDAAALRKRRAVIDVEWNAAEEARAKRRRDAIEAYHIAKRDTMDDVDLRMPVELWWCVADFLELDDCLRLSATCRALRGWYTRGEYAPRRHVIQHRGVTAAMAVSHDQLLRRLWVPNCKSIRFDADSASNAYVGWQMRPLPPTGAWLSITAFEMCSATIYDCTLRGMSVSHVGYSLYGGYLAVSYVAPMQEWSHCIIFGVGWKKPLWFDAGAKYRLVSAPTYDGHLLLYSDKWERPLDTTTGEHVPVPVYPDSRRAEVLRLLGVRGSTKGGDVDVTRCGDLIFAKVPKRGFALFRVYDNAVEPVVGGKYLWGHSVLVTNAGVMVASTSSCRAYRLSEHFRDYDDSSSSSSDSYSE